MFRLFCCLVGILLLAPAQRLVAQAQTNVPPATTPRPDEVHKPMSPKPAPAQVDSEIDTDEPALSDGSPWMAQQADALLDVVSCYLDKATLQREVAQEIKGNGNDNPSHLIEVRIHLLKTLAMHNAVSHCR